MAIALATLPSAFLARTVDNISKFASWVIHYVVAIPAIIVPLLQQFEGLTQAMMLSAAIAACACVFNFANGIAVGTAPRIALLRLRRRTIIGGCIAVAVVSASYIITTHGSALQLTGFIDVYEQRFQFSERSTSVEAYLIPFLGNVVLPFLLVTGVLRKNWIAVFLSLFGTVLLYTTFAAKSQLLGPIFVLGVLALFDRADTIRVALIPIILVSLMTLGIAVAPSIDGSDTALNLIASLIYVRTLLLPGVIVGEFSAYFSQFATTYYSHSLIGRPFVPYPYGDLSVGQVVGLYMFPNQGSAVFELNGSFIATDGLAALYMIGIPIAYTITAIALRFLTFASTLVDARTAFAVTVPFLVTLANTSIFSSMVTGGGLALAVLLYLWGNSVTDADPSNR
ncbi:MAG: hypothetical protein ACKVOP_04290 [Sphingomonadaceae bacterium]